MKAERRGKAKMCAEKSSRKTKPNHAFRQQQCQSDDDQPPKKPMFRKTSRKKERRKKEKKKVKRLLPQLAGAGGGGGGRERGTPGGGGGSSSGEGSATADEEEEAAEGAAEWFGEPSPSSCLFCATSLMTCSFFFASNASSWLALRVSSRIARLEDSSSAAAAIARP